MISDIKRKTLPAISRAVGLSNEQGLLHFKGRITLEIITIKTCNIKTDFTSLERARNYTNY